MAVRLRDQLLSDEDTPAPSIGWREAFGLPAGDDSQPDAIREKIAVSISGIRLVCFADIVALAGMAALIFGYHDHLTAPWTAVTVAVAAVLGGDMCACMPAIRRRSLANSGWLAVALLSGASLLSVGGWTALIALFANVDAQITAVATAALFLGMLATTAMPVLFAERLTLTLGVGAVMLGRWDAIVAGAVLGAFAVVVTLTLARRRDQNDVDQLAQLDAGYRNAELICAYEESGRGWFWQTNARGRLTYLTPSIAAMFGRSVEALKGEDFATLLVPSGAGKTVAEESSQTIAFTLGAGLEFSDCIVRAPFDEERWWSLSGVPILDAHGRCLGFNGSGTDLTERQKAEADTNRLANFDGLTGLPNRSAMRRTLEEILEDDGFRTPSCGLFLLDLDRFKNVNDTLGHPMGDALLKVVAQRLARVVGKQGQVGRLGGDEFKVIVPEAHDRTKLADLAETIISRLSLPYVIDDCTIQIGATVGIAIAPSDGTDPDELTRNADLALYAAKAAGKGVHRFYTPEMHSQANALRSIENDLRDVLVKEQLSIMYQSVVDAESEALVGFEALLRWDHPDRGMIPPSVFIPIAEELNLIGRIGDWVIRTACTEAARWPEHLHIAVNLSPLQFASAGLTGTIVGALADSGLAPGRLELEVTEGVLLNEDPIIDRNFSALIGLGVQLSLDDFGTGYASLAYLKRVPFNKVKIDRSFVRGAADQVRNQAIIRAMVNLAESLDMETVAEGAETLDEVELIRSLGCSQIQGYIFGHPLDAEAAARRAAGSTPPSETREQVDREPRLALLRVAQLTSRGRQSSVKIRNISAHGALIVAPGDIPLGSRVEVELSDGWQFGGEIRWRRGHRFGIAFDEPIAVRQFVAGAPAPVRSVTDDAARPQTSAECLVADADPVAARETEAAPETEIAPQAESAPQAEAAPEAEAGRIVRRIRRRA